MSVDPTFNETASAAICEGDSYVFGAQTLTTSGEYTEEFQSQAGCDSTVVLTLNVNSAFNETASAAICEGDSYAFGAQTLTTAGEFTEVFQSQAGCDSTVVLVLSFKTQTECENPLNIDGELKDLLKVYPNPFKDEVSFEFDNPMNGVLKIHNVSGSLVYESSLSNSTNEKVSSIKASGTYIVTIMEKSGEITKFKIVKQ